LTVQTNINNVVEMLSDDRKVIIYKLALDMLSAQQSENFDSFTSEEIKQIHESQERIKAGDYLSFSSTDEMMAHFGLQ